MASNSLVRVVVVCLATFSLALGISIRRKPPPKAKDALYDCFVKQSCDCKVHERFEECWDKLTQVSRDWLIDQLNQCKNDVTLEYGTLKAWTDLLCPLGHSINKPCYDVVNVKLMERVKEAGSGQLGEDEAVGFEMARKCIEPSIVYCTTFQDCMSEG